MKRPKEEIQAVRRIFGSLPVRDATADLYIVVKQEHIDKAIPRDPFKCAISISCQEAFGSAAVFTWRSRAYVDLPLEGKRGKRCLRRFFLSEHARRAVKIFDDTGKVPPGGFVLKAPPPSGTLEGHRVADRRGRAKRREVQREAKLKGEAIVHRQQSGADKRGGAPGVLLRDGSGMVHFKRELGE